MTLLNPWYLAGLLAVAVPILIHILQRDRIRRIKFPATRFLLGASRNITRTQAIRELILLIMRASAMALLAFALARPFFMKDAGAAGGGLGRTVVVLVDTSASMRIGSRMDEAKKAAKETVSKLMAGVDRVTLVAFQREPNVIVPMTTETSKVSAEIDNLQAGFGEGNFAAAVAFADTMLKADDYKNSAREIDLFSDLQRSGWAAFKGDRLSPGVTLNIKPAALSAPTNVSVAQAAIPKSTVISNRNETLAAQIVNYSKTDYPGLKVALQVNGKKVDEKDVNLGPDKTEIVRFNYKFDQPGDVSGSIDIDAKDDVADDNSYYFDVRVLPLVKVLLCDGKPNVKADRSDARFVKMALSVPGTPFQIAETLPSNLSAKDLEDVKAVILAGVDQISEPGVAALKKFVENGGGLLFFPGETGDLEVLNKTFAGLLPCRLKDLKVKDAKSDGWTFGELDLQHPIFVHFSAPQSGDFSAARFPKFFQVTDSQASRVLARFIDGSPAFLESSVGSGHCLLFASPLTTSAGAQWSDFCLQGGIFLPFVHESIKYLAVHAEAVSNSVVADVVSIPRSDAQLTAPDGSTPALASGSLVPKFPGLYTVKSGDTVEHIAVNVPRLESEPALIDIQEITAATASDPDGMQKEIEGAKVWVAASSSVRERVEGSQKLGWYLLFGLMALLVAEHVLANNTSRR